ncbi:MAG: Holliday junction resolvase RuvX [Planctomycetaceae bacterium]|nr:Holliday junction resolvase RuvX [Planctomycetaceae bacterium]
MMQVFPDQGALLGLDFGTKRLGIAISTSDQSIASPLENYNRVNTDADAKAIQKLANDYQIQGIVVGLPVHMSGDEGGKAAEARAFGDWVGEVTGLPVAYFDERYTSSLADVYLQHGQLSDKKRKANRDKIAAQIMLQNFLDSDDRWQAPGPIDERGSLQFKE